MTGYDQAQYWLERHKRLQGDPRSVGNLGQSIEENLRSETVVNEIVARAAALLAPARTVLDVGCGYGRISRSFTDQGYDYLGVDVSEDAIRQARERNPAAGFEVGDLAYWSTDRRFDVVCLLYVLIHFVDDARWLSLLERALSWVAPGGALLIAEQFTDSREVVQAHVVCRPLKDYQAVIERHGFAFDAEFQQKLIGGGEKTLPKAATFHLARRTGSGRRDVDRSDIRSRRQPGSRALRHDIDLATDWLRTRVVAPLGLESGPVLDLGCGEGTYTEAWRRLGFDAVGVDVSAASVTQAALDWPEARFVRADAADLPYEDGTFAVIFVRGMSWYHRKLNDGVRARTRELCRLLAPGGVFVLAMHTDFSGRSDETAIVHNTLDRYLDLADDLGHLLLCSDWRGRDLRLAGARRASNIVMAVAPASSGAYHDVMVRRIAALERETAIQREAVRALDAGLRRIESGLDPAGSEGPASLVHGEVHRLRQFRAIQDVAAHVIPPGSRVIVVSRGDDDLVALGACETEHFPQDVEGRYAGHHPANGKEAVDGLTALRRGASDFFLLPATSFWWLEFYPELREHLDEQHRRVWADEHCVIYRLTPPPDMAHRLSAVRFAYTPPGSDLNAAAIELEGLHADEHIIEVIRDQQSFYERDLLEHLWAAGPRGGTFVDVGANIGNHTVYFARYLAEHVVAVEPDSALLPVLRRNIAANTPEDRVTVWEAALGASTGAGDLARRDSFRGNAGAGQVQAHYGQAPGQGQVSVLTLDDLVESLGARQLADVRLVKLDVEGMELDVLKGATALLANLAPDLVVEAATEGEHDALVRFLARFRYVEVGRYCRTPVYHFIHQSRTSERF